MEIFSVEKSTFYTEEYSLSDIVVMFDSFEKAVKYVQEKFKVTIGEVGEFEQISEDEELGEIYIGIVLREVN